MSKFGLCVLFLIVGLAIGLYFGRCHVTEKTVVEYKEMPTVSISVTPDPVHYSIPELPMWIIIEDRIDTAAILNDWITKREYKGLVGNDTVGHVQWSAVVQYNQLPLFNLDFTPVQRMVTTTVERKLASFVFIGFNSAGYGSAEAGVFLGKWGVAAEIGTDFKGKSYGGGKVGFKF